MFIGLMVDAQIPPMPQGYAPTITVSTNPPLVITNYVTLTWNPGSGQWTAIFISTDLTNWNPCAVTGTNIITLVQTNQACFYTVKSFNWNGWSPISNIITNQ